MPHPKIRLVNCDLPILQPLLKGDEHIAQHLQIEVPAQWTEFGAPAFQYAKDQITQDPTTQIWWTYLPILSASNTLVGSCGYKGPPDQKGQVEIGYEVARNYRGQGLATEMAQQLVDKAFKYPAVKVVLAHTLAEENASVKVLKKCHFTFVEEIADEEDGNIWKWQRLR